MNLVLNGVKYHAKEPQRFFNRFSFICGALRLLHILCLCLIVAFPLNDSAFPLNLRDIQCRNRKTCVFLDVSFDFVTGCGSMAFGRRYTSLPISSLMAICSASEILDNTITVSTDSLESQSKPVSVWPS